MNFACNFVIHLPAREHTRCTKDPCHEFTLGLPQHMCGVATGTVATGNEMQLFLQLIS